MKSIFLLIISLCVVGTLLAFSAGAGKILFSLAGPRNAISAPTTTNMMQMPFVKSTNCAADSTGKRLSESTDPGLQKLAEYQKAFGESTFKQLMVFSEFPASTGQAKEMAEKMAATISEYDSLCVTPLVVVEPINGDGIISFQDIASGNYNEVLDSYFSTLRANSITGGQMGTWVPLPEPNSDAWGKNNADPADFIPAFNTYAAILKKYFPDADVSLLIDSQTYDWQTDDFYFQALDPYLSGIKKENISSFGLQGFPWAPQAGSTVPPMLEASVFLGVPMAISAADKLEIKSLWFNTGTFSSAYADNAKVVTLSPAARNQIMAGILKQAELAKNQGYSVFVNIFSQDKSRDSEAIDWSYGIGNPAKKADADVLRPFIAACHRQGIGLSLFDSR